MEIKIETEGYGETYLKDMDIGKKVLDVLEKYYAYHAWFVDCNHEAGTVSIQLMYQGPRAEMKIWKFGFLLHLNKLDSGNMDKKVMRAGGEILERYHIARKRATENDLIDFMSQGVDDRNMVR